MTRSRRVTVALHTYIRMMQRMDDGKPFLALQQALVARLKAMSIREQTQYYREVLALREACSVAESGSAQGLITNIASLLQREEQQC